MAADLPKSVVRFISVGPFTLGKRFSANKIRSFSYVLPFLFSYVFFIEFVAHSYYKFFLKSLLGFTEADSPPPFFLPIWEF